MSFDFDSDDDEFPSTKHRSLREQTESMSVAELAHQLGKEWENQKVVEALTCEALARILRKSEKLEDKVSEIASHLGVSKKSSWEDDEW